MTVSFRSQVRRFSLLFVLWTLIGLATTSIVLTAEWASRKPVSVGYVLLRELTGAYTFLLLLPGLLLFIGRFPIQRGNWWRRLPLHFAFTVVFGSAHTLLMWGTRSLLFELLGFGPFDYGLMGYRFLMEYLKQLPAYWLVYSVVAVIAYVKRARERELQTAQLRTQLTEARLNALKMQLNPHFLFNALNLVSSLVRADPDRADTMISHLSDFLRQTLRDSDLQEVPLEKELEFLGAYVEITKARFEERLDIEIDVTPEARTALVPHLVLQPLVENAVAHGTAHFATVGRVRVAGWRDGGWLRVRVEDNGPGVDGDPQAALGRGVGLSNTLERLRTLYGQQHRLDLVNLPEGGLRLTLELPWRESGPAAVDTRPVPDEASAVSARARLR